MPVAAYYAWERLGNPLTPAQPIRELVDKLKAAFPAAAEQGLFSWYANDAHYTAVPAEDHTPYSQTGWPGPSPQWFVFATDVSHRPDLGVDIGVLGAYWLAEARAGRMPWLKYMNWDGGYYDVRNDWRWQASSDDPGHVHLSARTDHLETSLGAWSPVPGAPLPNRKANGMFRLIDPEGKQFVIAPDTLSVTEWSYSKIEDPISPQGWMLVAAGIGTANGNPADPNHDPHANNDWRPGTFGPSKAEVRAKLIDDIAAKVVANLPPGSGGSAPTLEQIRKVVDEELDEQSLGGADKD